MVRVVLELTGVCCYIRLHTFYGSCDKCSRVHLHGYGATWDTMNVASGMKEESRDGGFLLNAINFSRSITVAFNPIMATGASSSVGIRLILRKEKERVWRSCVVILCCKI